MIHTRTNLTLHGILLAPAIKWCFLPQRLKINCYWAQTNIFIWSSAWLAQPHTHPLHHHYHNPSISSQYFQWMETSTNQNNKKNTPQKLQGNNSTPVLQLNLVTWAQSAHHCRIWTSFSALAVYTRCFENKVAKLLAAGKYRLFIYGQFIKV